MSRSATRSNKTDIANLIEEYTLEDDIPKSENWFLFEGQKVFSIDVYPNEIDDEENHYKIVWFENELTDLGYEAPKKVKQRVSSLYKADRKELKRKADDLKRIHKENKKAEKEKSSSSSSRSSSSSKQAVVEEGNKNTNTKNSSSTVDSETDEDEEEDEEPDSKKAKKNDKEDERVPEVVDEENEGDNGEGQEEEKEEGNNFTNDFVESLIQSLESIPRIHKVESTTTILEIIGDKQFKRANKKDGSGDYVRYESDARDHKKGEIVKRNFRGICKAPGCKNHQCTTICTGCSDVNKKTAYQDIKSSILHICSRCAGKHIQKWNAKTIRAMFKDVKVISK